jgi:hypothetical protein
MMVMEVSKGDVSIDELSRCQNDARTGLYAAAMAGFIKYLAASDYGRLSKNLRSEVEELRDKATLSNAHCRTPEIVANLMLGWKHFLAFATSAGAITVDEADDLAKRAWTALGVAAQRQTAHQIASEPTRRFLDLIGSAIASGHAHIAADGGCEPTEPQRWGWRPVQIGSGQFSRTEWQAQGDRIGWLKGDQIYLDSDASYRVAQMMAGAGDGLAISVQTLRKRLAEKNLLIKDENRNELTIRRTLEGVSRHVIGLQPGCLILEKPAKPAKPASDDDFPPENGESMAGEMAGFAREQPETRHQNSPFNRGGANGNGHHGGNGGNGGLSAHRGHGLEFDSYAAQERAAIQEDDSPQEAVER